MGCRCCRMIQSYIFDPPEEQLTGYFNEGNTSSINDQETDQEKMKIDSEIVIHKNELKNERQEIIVNNNKLSSSEAGHGNHGRDVNEETVGNCVEKCDTAVNGLVSNTFLYPILNYHANQMKETSNDAHLTLFSESSVPGDFEMRAPSHPNTSGKESIPEVDAGMTLDSEEPESIQDESSESLEENNSLTESAILEMPNATILVQDGILNDYCQTGYSSDDEVIAFSNDERDFTPNTAFPLWKFHNFNLSLDRNRVLDPSERPNQTEVAVAYFKEGLYNGGQWIDSMVVDEGVAEDFSSEELSGEDIEDADVAEALAALDAATAGEDEDEDY